MLYSNNSKEIQVEFKKIGHNGVSIGDFNNKVVFAYGILPGEIVKIKVLKEKKNFIEGELLEIIKASPHRVLEGENHYLSCSPWQTFDYNFQIEIKKQILKEIFQKFAKIEINLEKFFSANKIYGYRTKIEYSFLEEENILYYAFYKRGDFFKKIKLPNGCFLISEKANQLALKLLEEINKQNLKDIKGLIIRKSHYLNDLHFSLFIKNKNYNFNFNDKELSGFALIYSNPKTSINKIDEVLKEEGQNYIREKILNLEFRYPYTSFFQNNIELFEEALKIMKKYTNNPQKVVDLYCGVGVIGLSIGGEKIIGIDNNENAIKYAKLNALLNNINNFEGIFLRSEKISEEFLKNTDVLILDPPRTGLHPKLIKLILNTKPQNIFYLSCNPITQARDFFLLKDYYELINIYGFDFYPQTPHIESLIVLKLI